jgi:FkbM family methyltransferase
MRISYYIETGFIQLVHGKLLDFLRIEFHKYYRRRKYRQQEAKIKWWKSHQTNKQGVEFKLQSGVKLKLDFDSALSKLIYCYDFELLERKFINSFLRPGDIFVDVGANIGLFALIAAKLVGKKGSVHAFEPCSLTYNRLKLNVKLNNFSNIYCHQFALSNRNCQQNMILSLDGFDAWNSLAKPTAGESFSSETINTMRWDDFAFQHQLQGKVTLMKIDVEGWETFVLSGGIETLSREDAPTLLVEFTEKAAQSANSSCRELYQNLEKLGYKMFTYNPDCQELISYPLQVDYPHLNLIAVKQPKIVEARLQTNKKTRWLR